MAGARPADKQNGQRHQRLAEAEATPAQCAGVSRSRNQAAAEGGFASQHDCGGGADFASTPPVHRWAGRRPPGRRAGAAPVWRGRASRNSKGTAYFQGDQLRARTTEAERLGWVGPYCMVQLFVKHIASFANSFAKLFAKLLFNE